MITFEKLESEIARFEAAGNTVIGRPKIVRGDVQIVHRGTSGSFLKFGDGCTVGPQVFQFEQGNGRIELGENSVTRGRYFSGEGCLIGIGRNTVMNEHGRFSAAERTSILIGEGCLFANVEIMTCDWHAIWDVETNERINPSESVQIGDRVWLGRDVMVQKGATIGHDCVVAAGSIVMRKAIPPHSIAVGRPAEAKRSGIRWTRSLDGTA